MRSAVHVAQQTASHCVQAYSVVGGGGSWGKGARVYVMLSSVVIKGIVPDRKRCGLACGIKMIPVLNKANASTCL